MTESQSKGSQGCTPQTQNAANPPASGLLQGLALFDALVSGHTPPVPPPAAQVQYVPCDHSHDAHFTPSPPPKARQSRHPAEPGASASK